MANCLPARRDNDRTEHVRVRRRWSEHQALLKNRCGSVICDKERCGHHCARLRQKLLDRCSGKNHGAIVLRQGCRPNTAFHAKCQGLGYNQRAGQAKISSAKRFLCSWLQRRLPKSSLFRLRGGSEFIGSSIRRGLAWIRLPSFRALAEKA